MAGTLYLSVPFIAATIAPRGPLCSARRSARRQSSWYRLSEVILRTLSRLLIHCENSGSAAVFTQLNGHTEAFKNELTLVQFVQIRRNILGFYYCR
jgi:hypothetical protein